MQAPYQGKLAVLFEGIGELAVFEQLAQQLAVPLRQRFERDVVLPEAFFLTWREGCLRLLDHELLSKGGLTIDIEPRPGEQRSWPAPKDGALAQAIGRKTHTVLDATTGWAQDSLHLFRMGYQVTCIERSPIMHALISDAFARLTQLSWVQQLTLQAPQLLAGDAISLLPQLTEVPECIYLDPMFPPKRKKSALPQKSLLILRELLGDDPDKDALFAAAMQVTSKRVVVKCPHHAEPLGAKPSSSFAGKLVRYDVYLKS